MWQAAQERNRKLNENAIEKVVLGGALNHPAGCPACSNELLVATTLNREIKRKLYTLLTKHYWTGTSITCTAVETKRISRPSGAEVDRSDHAMSHYNAQDLACTADEMLKAPRS